MSTDTPDTDTDSDREQAVLLQEQDPIAVLQSLPPTVFPVTAKVKLERTQSGDQRHDGYDRSPSPVELREPATSPYVPETTVYFDNPAERAPDGATVWQTREAVCEFQSIVEYLDAETRTDADRLKLSGLCLVELPPRYLTSKDGEHVADPTLYEANGDMTLAYFQKDSSLAAHNVREDLGDALPDRSRSPLQLTRVDEVTAKPARAARTTTQQASRCRYYTESEADAHNDLDATPAIWQARRVSDPSDSVRPLTPVVNDLDAFLPALADTDLLEDVTFAGRTQSQERFYADQILGN